MMSLKNKKIMYFLAFFYLFVPNKFYAIEPVEIGKKFQEDIEINSLVVDEITKDDEMKIVIDKDIRRTKFKKKTKAVEKNVKKIFKKSENKELKNNELKVIEKKVNKSRETLAYINDHQINKEKLEVFFNDNSANIIETELAKLIDFINKSQKKENLKLKITAYAKKNENGNNDKSRRLSLDRAINIRTVLLENGISAQNLIVKALGNINKKNTENKVDVEIVKKL